MTEHKPTLKELIAERDELLARKEENSEVITGCRAQIEAANARYHADGERTDPKWYAAAKTRMHYAGLEDQQIARRLSEVKKLIRAANTEQHSASHNGTGDAVDLLKSAISLIGQVLDQLREQGKKDVTHETTPLVTKRAGDVQELPGAVSPPVRPQGPAPRGEEHGAGLRREGPRGIRRTAIAEAYEAALRSRGT